MLFCNAVMRMGEEENGCSLFLGCMCGAGVYSTAYLGTLVCRIRGGVCILSVCPFPVSPSLSAFACTVMYRLCIDVQLSMYR